MKVAVALSFLLASCTHFLLLPNPKNTDFPTYSIVAAISVAAPIPAEVAGVDIPVVSFFSALNITY